MWEYTDRRGFPDASQLGWHRQQHTTRRGEITIWTSTRENWLAAPFVIVPVNGRRLAGRDNINKRILFEDAKSVEQAKQRIADYIAQVRASEA
ncbi:hypothetical protein AB4Z40_34330 [Bosea sp. 2YAB26]|uniref:hypothetical protein n=1 Tax=Bosea sp. 2YAB26 TaxID=3237478 RepID=UPI003F916DEA